HNDLEMDVRRPVAIFLRRADAANALAARDALARTERRERISRQVTVKGEKLCAIAGRVPKDNERAIIHGRGIVRKGVNDAVERGVSRTARFDKKIDAQVDGARLIGRISPSAKERSRMQEPLIAV